MRKANLTSLTVLILALFCWTIPAMQAQVQCEPEAEFTYDPVTYCIGNENTATVTHTTGTDGIYTYSVNFGGPNLAINPSTGSVDVDNSDFGFYTVTNTVSMGGSSSLVITGVIDSQLSGGVPKAVEFFALTDIPDLSIYGFGAANNGGGSDGEEYTFPADAVAAGTYIWVATNATSFNDFFGFDPTYTNGTAPNVNGDDAIELFCNGMVIDVFGDINTNGDGEPWEYTDGWAYRINETGPDGSTFEIDNWDFSGPNALDGAGTNGAANLPFPIGTFANNCATGGLVISGVIDGPLSGGVPKAVEFYAISDIPDLSIYGFGAANNGGGSDGEEYTFPADAVSQGTFIWVATNTTSFNDFFGFDPTYTNGTAPNVNGDDAIELFRNGVVHDVFGDINTNGDGEPWEYTDGWAYRSGQTGPDGSVFQLGSWNFSGPNALDGETTNAGAATPFPIGTYFYECPVDVSYTCEADIFISEPALADAGPDQIICGLSPVQMAADPLGFDFDGVWSGGLGSFDDNTDPFATYTPHPDEEGSTVVLTWTVEDSDGMDGPCMETSDDMLLTILEEPDAEFSYSMDEYCPNADPITPLHNTGVDGIYSYMVVSGGPILDIDPETGVIDPAGSDQGTYDVTNTVGGCGNLVISGIVDGDVPGGLPKAIEFTAVDDIPDLSIYGFGSANNGGGSDGIEFTFPADAITNGTSVWVATESVVFTNFFGFPPTYVDNFAASINGDDAIELFCNGILIDLFGDQNTDGTGEPWEYTNGWAYRNASTGPDGPAFVLGNWFFSGPDGLMDAADNADAEIPMPIDTYFSTVGGLCPNDEHTVTITIQDILPPDLTCPDDITITLNPGLCGTFVDFLVSAVDNCDPDPTITQTDGGGLGSGDYFEIGTYTLDFTATDIFDNSSDCSFDIEIIEYPFPEDVVCNDFVQISLDQSGTAVIGADDILEGGPYGCYDDYIVNVLNDANGPLGNVVDCSYIGDEWVVMVTDPDTDNSCWSTIIVEDKLGPVFDCPTAPIQIGCTEDVDAVPAPFVQDNCTFPVIPQLVEEEWVDTDACDDGIAQLNRTWIAVDEYGNQSLLCTQIIQIVRPDDVDFPNDITWECTQFAEYPSIVDPTPLDPVIAALAAGNAPIDATNVPVSQVANTGSGIPLDLDGQYCGYSYGHSDEVVPTCGNTFKIIRTWTVLDWCTNTVITTNEAGEDNVQVVKVVDSTPPVINIDDYSVSANVPGQHPQPCTSQDFLPPADIVDACSDFTVSIFTPIGEADYLNGVDGAEGGFIPWPGLEQGTHQILYQAEDECNNVSEYWVQVTVVDDIAPVTICDEITDVSLDAVGLAEVPADVFDDGSYDNCCLDEFLVRRMDGDCDGNYDEFGPTVEFCCSDVSNNPIMVIFRAKDCEGNHNDCMVEVEVEDKIPPTVTCPQPVTVDCDFYLDNLAAAIALGDYSVLEQFGNASYYDNCVLTPEYEVAETINTCTEGNITRTWTVDDGVNPSQSCSQTIFVEHVSDWVVEFPLNIDAVCEDGELPEFGEPQIFHDECELIGTSYEDQYFYVVPDACYKIVRTWTVINWCVYDDYGYDVWSEEGYAECNLFMDWDGDGDFDCRTFRDGWNESGTPGTPDGYIWYEQVIKVIDDEAPVFDVEDFTACIEETDCDTDVTLPTPDVEDCALEGVEIIVTSDLPNGTADQYVYEDVPPGTYTALYEVTDNCGNVSYDEIEITVEDCKKPTPYCVNGLVIELMPTGMVTTWAVDFDAGSFDNCPGDLQLSFSADVNDIQLDLGCGNVNQQTVVELWVTDAAGNQDFCETFVIVQDNMGACQAVPVQVAGVIETEEGADVADVQVDVNGGIFSDVTNNFGEYELELPEGGDYSITPMYDVDAGNGVTTYDMVLISRHILGIEYLDSPYKLIAADANNSGQVTTLDLVDIRKVILLIEDHFPNNTSWRFVDADHVFSDPTDPFSAGFPEVINYNNLAIDDLLADFVGVKVGDVNGTAEANSQNGSAEDRTITGTLSFQTKDEALKAGTTVRVDFSLTDVAVYGYQYTLNFDAEALELIDLIPGTVSADHFGMTLLDKGAITTSWNSAELEAFRADEVLFSLEFAVRTDAQLSNLLSLNSRYTEAEAYSAEGLMDVELNFAGAGAREVVLYQNEPNPFTGATRIGFELPEASYVSLKVMDVNGEIVRIVAGDFAKGYNSIDLKDLEGSGLFYYQLETADFTATRKMIQIK